MTNKENLIEVAKGCGHVILMWFAVVGFSVHLAWISASDWFGMADWYMPFPFLQ